MHLLFYSSKVINKSVILVLQKCYDSSKRLSLECVKINSINFKIKYTSINILPLLDINNEPNRLNQIYSGATKSV